MESEEVDITTMEENVENDTGGPSESEVSSSYVASLLKIQDKAANELARISCELLNYNRNVAPKPSSKRKAREERAEERYHRLQAAMERSTNTLQSIIKGAELRDKLLQMQQQQQASPLGQSTLNKDKEDDSDTAPEGTQHGEQTSDTESDGEAPAEAEGKHNQEEYDIQPRRAHTSQDDECKREPKEDGHSDSPAPKRRRAFKSLADLPQFSRLTGQAEVRTHLAQLEIYAKIYDYAESLMPRLLLASLKNDVETAQWFGKMMDTHAINTWEIARKIFLEHCEPSSASQGHKEKVLNCSQRSDEDVPRYTARFTNLLREAKMDSHESFVLTSYVKGLLPHLQNRVKEKLASDASPDFHTLRKVADYAAAIAPFVDTTRINSNNQTNDCCTICKATDHLAGPTCPIVIGKVAAKFDQTEDRRQDRRLGETSDEHCKLCEEQGRSSKHASRKCDYALGLACSDCKKAGRSARHRPTECRYVNNGKQDSSATRSQTTLHLKHMTSTSTYTTKVTHPDFFSPISAQENDAQPHLEFEDQIFVAVRLNDSAPIKAEADPGANTTFIAERLCNELNLTIKHQQFKVKMGNGTTDWSIGVTRETVRVLCGTRVVLCQPIVMKKLDGAELYLGRPELLRLGILQLNLPNELAQRTEQERSPSARRQQPDDEYTDNPYNMQYNRAPRVADIHPDDQRHHDQIMKELEPLIKQNSEITGFANVKPIRLHLADTKPVWIPQYPIAESQKPAVREQIEKWERNGKVEKIDDSNGWNNPLNPQPKFDKAGNITGTRVCFDARNPNRTMRNDGFPIPSAREIFRQFTGNRIFAEIDLDDAFLQLELDKQDRDITAFTFNNQSYRFRGCPYGLKVLSNTFQRAMTRIFGDMPFVRIYIDNIMLASRDWKEHQQHLQQVLQRCNEMNLRISTKKLLIGRRAITMLGMQVNRDGVAPDKSKVESVMKWPFPETHKALQSFLGVVNFVRPHLRHLADLEAALNKARASAKAYDKEIRSNRPAMEEAFEIIKEAIAHAPILRYPDFKKEFHLAIDASRSGIGAVLYQLTEEQTEQGDTSITAENIVAISSRALNKHERNYPVSKLETLAIVTGLKEFHEYLYGRHFQIYTDHRSLSYLLNSNNNNNTLRNWLDTIQTYSFTIQHIPGYLNVLPDALSRLYTGTTSWGVPEYKLHALTCDHKIADKTELMDSPYHQKRKERS